MSRDVAKLIYELAYNREVDLKKYYIDSVKHYNNRTRIERAIKKAIKNDCKQTRLCINDCIDFDILYNMIIPIPEERYNNFHENERIYCFKIWGCWYTIHSSQLQFRDLIKNVIIPLDLRWSLEGNLRNPNYKNLIVHWAHWKKSE